MHEWESVKEVQYYCGHLDFKHVAVRQSPSLDSFKRNLKAYYFASQ